MVERTPSQASVETENFKVKQQAVWVQEVRQRRETELGPSPEDIDILAQLLVGSVEEEIDRYGDMTLDDDFFEAMACLRGFAQGLSKDGRSPCEFDGMFMSSKYQEMEELFKGFVNYTPEDFESLVDAIYFELSKKYDSWVQEVKERRKSHPGPSDELMKERVSLYRQKKSEISLETYKFRGPDRDLKFWALGRAVSRDPSEISSDFLYFLPEDFLELVYEVNRR